MNLKLDSKKKMPSRKRGKSAGCFCMFPKVHSTCQTQGVAPVYLNVYDLTPVNGYIFWTGLGVFHSGIEVHGVEYAFGAHGYPMSGVFEVEPRQWPGFRFRKSIFMGMTSLDASEIREFMELQSLNYYGNAYHLVNKNCNHFCKDICFRLTGKKIPKWVNRLAGIGAVCNRMLPKPLKIPAVCREHEHQNSHEDRQKLRSPFSCLSSCSSSRKQSPVSSIFLNSSSKDCLSPWSTSPLKER